MSKNAPSILVIDDEVQMRRMLRISLEAAGYRVWEAESAEQGLVEAASRKPDVVVLDLSLPDGDGVQVLKRLREWSPVPVVVLSVRDNENDKIEALDAGADDYVTKPFHTDELLARLRVARRHASPHEPIKIFEESGLFVDLVDRMVKVHGVAVELTPTQYAILRLLVTHAGKVLTHRHILREIWGPKNSEQSQYLRVYISQLRSKLRAAGAKRDLIKTESGVGYRLDIKS
jgi:two-component system, OmpR family, KDP operon response regulator KdpE